MTEQEMKELGKEAAKTSVLAASRMYRMNSIEAADAFLEVYEYTIQKLYEKQRQTQRETTQEFGENSAKFR